MKIAILAVLLTTSLAASAFAAEVPSTADLLTGLKSSAQATGDNTLTGLSGDLGSKVTALSDKLGDSPAAQGQLQSAVQSLSTSSNNLDSLSAFQKLADSKLPAGGGKLAKEVKNLSGAYLLQKNLGAVPGIKTEVSEIVSSLAKGDLLSAIPALQKVAQTSSLTGTQKDFLTGLATRFTPGADKVGGLLKGIPGFGQ